MNSSVRTRGRDTLAGASPYTLDFFKDRSSGSSRSAQVIVPLVLDLVHPSSVVDVGCGVGTWLNVFQQLGVQDVLGIDGPYVDLDEVLVSPANFRHHELTQPIEVGRTFDLAVSLEVGEHLEPQFAPRFVQLLVSLAPVVLFSAAVPHQGGTHHVNEQWPGYWAALFQEHGYVAIDAIRRRVWSDERVDWWYAQNTLIYCRSDVLSRYTGLGRARECTSEASLALVHPRNYADNWLLVPYHLRRASVKQLLTALPGAAARALRRRLVAS
jgi:SAM-dependent methyltransferase